MRIVFSMGDPNGIGPEIILKSWLRLRQSGHSFAVAGSWRVMDYYRRKLDLPVELEPLAADFGPEGLPTCSCALPVVNIGDPATLEPGRITAEAGRLSMASLAAAAQLCRSGSCDGLVTAPIHKEAIALSGSLETGHTGFLGRMLGTSDPIMLFSDRQSRLKVALATIHEPLAAVPSLIRNMDLDGFFCRLHDSLQADFGIERPRLAVLGLNPHASDGGVMGNEEAELLSPAITRLREAGMAIQGPFPADGFFGARLQEHYDVIVAMYHDQGLLPFKVLAFERGVNVTLGLPIVRTSPDHGTGFDRAGQGTASEESIHEAVLTALEIAQNRTTQAPRS